MNSGNLIINRTKQAQSSALVFDVLIDDLVVGSLSSGDLIEINDIEFGHHKLTFLKKILGKSKIAGEIEFNIKEDSSNLILNIKMDAFNNMKFEFIDNPETTKNTEDKVIEKIQVLSSENKNSSIGREKYELKGATLFHNARIVKQGLDYTVYTCKITYKSGKTEIKQVEQSFLNKYSDLVC